MLSDLYRKVVMNHSKYRRNYGKLEGEEVRKVHYKNPNMWRCHYSISTFRRKENKKCLF